MGDRPLAPLGIDPLHFSVTLFVLLILFVIYLLLPRGIRVHYFHAYPKRYVWSARSRKRRNQTPINDGTSNRLYQNRNVQKIGNNQGVTPFNNNSGFGNVPIEETGNFPQSPQMRHTPGAQQGMMDTQQNDEVIISHAMQQLRDPGVLIVAHGSRGKPKTVRLQLTESAITWRTESKKKTATGFAKDLKMGKLHSVSLQNIMYVDVGKQTTALRRVENAAVSETLCFSLLTKEGSLDLEANSPRERDALVSCFSLVLDEIHAQNWRDIYRGPSGDITSSFDAFDEEPTTAEAQR